MGRNTGMFKLIGGETNTGVIVCSDPKDRMKQVEYLVMTSSVNGAINLRDGETVRFNRDSDYKFVLVACDVEPVSSLRIA